MEVGRRERCGGRGCGGREDGRVWRERVWRKGVEGREEVEERGLEDVEVERWEEWRMERVGKCEHRFK